LYLNHIAFSVFSALLVAKILLFWVVGVVRLIYLSAEYRNLFKSLFEDGWGQF